jgi:hypothetical protein
MSFTKNKADPNLYYIFIQTDVLILVLYVDDLHRHDALLLGIGGLAETKGDFPWAG